MNTITIRHWSDLHMLIHNKVHYKTLHIILIKCYITYSKND